MHGFSIFNAIWDILDDVVVGSRYSYFISKWLESMARGNKHYDDILFSMHETGVLFCSITYAGSSFTN